MVTAIHHMDMERHEADHRMDMERHERDTQTNLINWNYAIMAVCTLCFLAAWFLWSFGLMPNTDKQMIQWFGAGTLGVDGAAVTAIISSKFGRRR
jgi:hypothetical protein